MSDTDTSSACSLFFRGSRDSAPSRDRSLVSRAGAFIGSLLLLVLAVHGPAYAQTHSAAPDESSSVQTNSAACDVTCIRNNSDRAARSCAPRIEAQAPIDFEWINRPFGNIFQEAEPSSESPTAVRYRGDSIRFLSPQREWTRVSYECVFDVTQNRIASVSVRLGRLNAPPAAPQAASASAGHGHALPSRPSAKQSSSAATPVRTKVRPGEPSPIEILQVRPRPGQASP